MKKTSNILLVVSLSVVVVSLVLVAGFFWLANSVQTYQTGYLNSAPGYMLEGRFSDIWKDVYPIPEPAKTEEITFMGKTYTGTYTQTVGTDNLSDPRKNLYTINGGAEFLVGSDSGKLLGFVFSGLGPSWFDKEYEKDDIANPEEFAISQARRVASEFINLENYEQLPLDSETINNEKGKGYTRYVVQFMKRVAGLNTTDYIKVYLTSKGTLIAVHFGDLGAFDNFQPSKLLKAKLDANLYTVAREAVKNLNSDVVKAQYRGHHAENQKLCLTPDGKIAVVTMLRIASDIHTEEQGTRSVNGALAVTTILSE